MSNSLETLSLSNCFLYVDDPDKALAFYRDALGMTLKNDVSNGDFRWLTIGTADQSVQVVLQQPAAMPISDEDKTAIAELTAKGVLGSLIFTVDDVDAAFAAIQATGAEVIQEPADQFYGVRDCSFRDPAGNMVRINQPLQQG